MPDIISQKSASMLKRRMVLITLAMAVLYLLLRLGFWQLARAAEKQTQIVALQRVLQDKHAIDLAVASVQSHAYQWAAGQVQFIPAPLLLLDNQRHVNQVGVRVYQFAKTSSGQIFLVEMGWLPVNDAREFPKPALLHGSRKLQGLLLPPPSAGFAIGAAIAPLDDTRLLLMRMDMPALAQYLKQPLAARVLRLDSASGIGFARDWEVLPNTMPPERHRGYAVQWFALAAAWLMLCVYVGTRRKHER
jgi:surfeit locus 1 family protein